MTQVNTIYTYTNARNYTTRTLVTRINDKSVWCSNIIDGELFPERREGRANFERTYIVDPNQSIS